MDCSLATTEISLTSNHLATNSLQFVSVSGLPPAAFTAEPHLGISEWSLTQAYTTCPIESFFVIQPLAALEVVHQVNIPGLLATRRAVLFSQSRTQTQGASVTLRR